MKTLSPLQTTRYKYEPEIPQVLKTSADLVVSEAGEAVLPRNNSQTIASFFPKTIGQPLLSFKSGENKTAKNKRKIGVLLSGGQASGGHNVISGLYDAIKEANKDSELFGFHMGPDGLIKNDYEILTDEKIGNYRNTGGFDIIGSGRTKIESESQVAAVVNTVKESDLDAIVVIGGDDSNTNAAFLAEQFKQKGLKTQVIGVPKTIDGDLKNDYIETSFGFDTAAKVYSECIGNLETDTASAQKYWNFVKLMGRSASHITLECALQVHPNIALIGEEIAAKNMTLKQILDNICDTIAKRAEKGENYGVILIPEGIIEFIPETKALIEELNKNWIEYEKVYTTLTTLAAKKDWLKNQLSAAAFETLDQLPDAIAEQFLGLRDPHGNIAVSQIETEKLFITMIKNRLDEMEKAGTYKGKFAPISLFYGYEGRSVFPTNFDANYCYALGKTAFLLIANGATGYISCVNNLSKPPAEWIPRGIPLTMMMDMEVRKGKSVPVISKSLVNLDGPVFKEFAEKRSQWAVSTDYRNPGAIQYFGPTEVCDTITETLKLESAAK